MVLDEERKDWPVDHLVREVSCAIGILLALFGMKKILETCCFKPRLKIFANSVFLTLFWIPVLQAGSTTLLASAPTCHPPFRPQPPSGRSPASSKTAWSGSGPGTKFPRLPFPTLALLLVTPFMHRSGRSPVFCHNPWVGFCQLTCYQNDLRQSLKRCLKVFFYAVDRESANTLWSCRF